MGAGYNRIDFYWFCVIFKKLIKLWCINIERSNSVICEKNWEKNSIDGSDEI